MKTQKRMRAGNKHKAWTNAEKKLLKTMTKDGKSIKEIANLLGRTSNAIAFQRIYLGCTTPKMKKGRVAKVVERVVNKPVGIQSTATRDEARDMARAAREIARANGKRITMAMFFVENF